MSKVNVTVTCFNCGHEFAIRTKSSERKIKGDKGTLTLKSIWPRNRFSCPKCGVKIRV